MSSARFKPSTADIEELTCLFKQSRFTDAERKALLLTTRFPQHGLAWKLLGAIYLEQKKYEKALKAAQRATALLPDDAAVFNNLGSILFFIKRPAEAELNIRRALAIAPNYAKALFNLSAVLRSQRQFTQAEACCRQALQIDPDYTNAHVALGNVLELQNKLHEAQACYRTALALDPDMPVLHSDLLHLYSLDAEVDAPQLLAAHLVYGKQFETPLQADWRTHGNAKVANRVLKIGFISGDLCHHALANYFEPLFAYLSQKPALSLTIYSNDPKADEVTQRLRAFLPQWQLISDLSDAALAQQIRADGIDILLDLTGHTARNRLLTFAHKPAPIQAAWLGYLGTSGLQAMDYYVCDTFWIPPNELDWQFTEKLAYLPSAVVFKPYQNSPPVNTLPALDNARITFGSFNRHNKINDTVIVLWSALLRRFPTARMVLLGIRAEFQEAFIAVFEREGIDRARLTVSSRVNQSDYLAMHHLVDFCLDTFPYGGGATTAHAAWMGVPTLCLVGQGPASRFSATEMHHLGLDDFITYNRDEFIEKGSYWATHLPELAAIRQGLRARFNASVLGQYPRFANNFEKMLRTMWQRWCQDLPPAALFIEDSGVSSTASPDAYETHFNQAFALQQQGRLDESVKCYIRALSVQPNNPAAYRNLGNILHAMGLLAQAEAYCRDAIALQPDLEKSHNHLGTVLHAQGKYAQAQASYRQALVLKPDCAEAYNNLAITLKDLGQGEAANEAYRAALRLKPDAATHGNLLHCMSLDVHTSPQALHAEHLAFGQHFEPALRAEWRTLHNTKNAARVLQIGFVSADLYNHALVNFLEPLFKSLCNKPSLQLHAYYTQSLQDAVTLRMRGHFAQWHAVAGLSDAALANQIRADGIDILIDLGGHTAHNRLLTFARKPAPIQASYLGYLGTTGLQAMDYYLCDAFWIPPGELDWQFTEKLAYLPAAVVFQPSQLAPPVNALPALANGYITFGSFNRANKLNASVIALWSMLLHSVPTARMLIGGLGPDSQLLLLQLFAQEGINLDRLTFAPRSNLPDYLALHHQVDFCLDSYPFGGGATTAHAAWMGVPTLSLAGESPASRFSATEMHILGLDGFIATSIEDFVDKGCYLATHTSELAVIRERLRSQFEASALGQAAQFADNFEAMLRTMWERWCSGLPPAAISREANI